MEKSISSNPELAKQFSELLEMFSDGELDEMVVTIAENGIPYTAIELVQKNIVF